LLLHALARLNERDREILRLSTWDDLDRHEIARVLGINENAVDQRLHRARRRLRDEYDMVARVATEARPKEASA
jgi:RNA polymerase sigma-70 factor (ECF subfamily)